MLISNVRHLKVVDIHIQKLDFNISRLDLAKSSQMTFVGKNPCLEIS